MRLWPPRTFIDKHDLYDDDTMNDHRHQSGRCPDLVVIVIAIVASAPVFLGLWFFAALSLMGDPGCPPSECPSMHTKMAWHDGIVVIGCLLLPAFVWLGSGIWAIVVNRRTGLGSPIAGRGALVGVVIALVSFAIRVFT
ncbi:MAG: hypothetical protein QM774_06650 [Gordonia sp. (in: high G+C Gram-positive bacteria)]|uniref:hypothetical protein n=1 Tax=Gordonia sp. (in: high G+C Gram-positive bacteria) TaxID=84139 RepID=UPI0039E5786D